MAGSESTDEKNQRPVRWIGRSRDDLREFPDDARREIGYSLSFAQRGEKHPSAKPLKGFKGAGVLEIVEDHRGDTYRAVYTVRFAQFVYVLHAFMKKSKSGIKTPQHEIELVQRRLKAAETDYREWQQENKDEGSAKDK
jgi:phage-related protein